MKFQLSDEQRALVRTIREVARNEFRGRALKYMDGTFPWENMRTLAQMGILGMAVPEEYGGTEMSVLDTALVLEEIAKHCYVTAMAVMGELGVQTRIISTFAPEHLKRRILPKVCSGEYILAVCMTEPHAGTDVANYRTNATIAGDRVKLKGVKTLISRVDEAQVFVVFSRIDNRPGREGIGCVLIEKGTPGFEVTARYHTMGGENLAEIRFEDCELPLENVILREDGFKKLLTPSTRSAASIRAFRSGSPKARSRKRSNMRVSAPRSAAPSAPSRACAGSWPRCTATSRPAAACFIALA
jgi:alkylation response protein AidB-like acyl-CoA dehydrogenase